MDVANLDPKTIIARTLAIVDLELRCAYVLTWFIAPADTPMAALEEVCKRAEAGEVDAKAVLFTLVDALSRVPPDVRVRLRRDAIEADLFALERLLRGPTPSTPPPSRNVPDYGKGRPLTLGERKSLARRPDRAMFDKLLADPHPDVIFRLLANPKLTESDVVRLAARRPTEAAVLEQVANTPRWVRSRRVRMALVCNPSCPEHIAARLTSLLLRGELEDVRNSPDVSPIVRQLCIEHLARRPPTSVKPDGSVH